MGRKGGIEVENLVREFRKGPRAVDAPRGFLAGEPTSSLPAYAIGFVLAFALWALFGLRRAEKAG